MRKHLMATVVWCEECTRQGKWTLGVVADHIVPKAKGGSDDRVNYQLLCEPCHDDKTIKEMGARPRPKMVYGSDGWPTDELRRAIDDEEKGGVG